MKKTLTTVALLFAAVAITHAQQYIYLSRSGIRDFMRFNIGPTQFSLTPKDSAARTAYGLHVSNEVKLVSGFWNKERAFTFHDAFYMDMSFGRMNNTPRKTKAGTSEEDVETRFSYTLNMGYLLLAGYRNPKWGVLAGIDFRFRGTRIGDMVTPDINGNLFNYSRPVVLRGEYCISKDVAEKRAIAMLWYDNGSATRDSYFSVRAEYPTGKSGRFWLYFQYTQQRSLGEDAFLFTPATPMSFKQLTLGLRIQNALL
ncbi:MAG: hypothetical protein V4658_11285 [Bacteroidota bacterium]